MPSRQRITGLPKTPTSRSFTRASTISHNRQRWVVPRRKTQHSRIPVVGQISLTKSSGDTIDSHPLTQTSIQTSFHDARPALAKHPYRVLLGASRSPLPASPSSHARSPRNTEILNEVHSLPSGVSFCMYHSNELLLCRCRQRSPQHCSHHF